MINKMKKLIVVAAIITFLISISATNKESIAATTNVTVGEYVKHLVLATKLELDTTATDPYITAAIAGGLITEGEFKDYNASITRTDTAVLTNRADELLHGTSFKEDLYKQVRTKLRISDLKKIPEAKQESVIKVFIKGIMIGDTNGPYTHDRTFNGSKKLTKPEEKTILTRLQSKSKRKELSPDGQLIRTTKLPKNYKDYPYILAAFPNGFYEKKFIYQIATYYNNDGNKRKPVEFKDYIRPINISQGDYNGASMQEVLDLNLDTWVKKVEINLHTRLNADYRKINNKWITKLRNTYYVYNDTSRDKYKTDEIKTYVNNMKKNKSIVIGSVSVEPSTLYHESGFYVRACIKFKVTSALKLDPEENIIFGQNIYLPKLKRNQWNTMYVDIRLSAGKGGGYGEDLAVVEDAIY